MAAIEIWQDSKRKSRCRSCSGAVEWAVSAKTGSSMPFDGEIVAVQTQGSMLTDRVREVVDTSVSPVHKCPPKPR